MIMTVQNFINISSFYGKLLTAIVSTRAGTMNRKENYEGDDLAFLKLLAARN